MRPITQTLKITESINCTLVPGDYSYLDKKDFEWELNRYGEEELGLNFKFDHPEFISTGGKPDTMRVWFNNTDVYLPAASKKWATMPSNFTMTFKIPPQGTGLLSEEEVKKAKQTGQAVVISNLFLSIFLQSTLSMMIGSIVVVQILAHLPLADIYLPANALQSFEIMVSFVTFDYFSPSDYINFGFSDVPVWSDNFAYLGIGSVNFVDVMGSIIVFAAVELLLVLLSAIVSGTRKLSGKNFL